MLYKFKSNENHLRKYFYMDILVNTAKNPADKLFSLRNNGEKILLSLTF